ncbi:MAG: hypothetical protein PVI81_06665 [Anaerolineales bacterium]
MRIKRFLRTILFLGLVITSACTSSVSEQIVTPDVTSGDAAAPTVTITESPTASPTDTESPPGPPTAAPPPTVETGPVPTLAAGIELDIAYIDMIDPEVGWAIGGVGGARDRVLYTTDGARSFSDITPPVGPVLEAGRQYWTVGAFLDRDHARVLYFPAVLEPAPPAGSDVVIWRTDDAGITWAQSQLVSTSVLGTQDFPPRLSFINPDEGWFMARNGGAGMHRYPISLYSSKDGGLSWQPLIEALGGSELQSCRKTGWAISNSLVGLTTIDNCPIDGPAIERSIDGGVTWDRVILPPPINDPDSVTHAYCQTFSPQAVDAKLVVLAATCTAYEGENAERDLFYRSGDGGETWDGWDFPGGELFFLDEARGFALSREIYWTADGGVTWEEQKTVNWDGQFSFVSPDVGWAVARNEGQLALVATTDRAQTWNIIEPVVRP